MLATPVQNHPGGPPAKAGVEGPGLFSGRKSSKKGGSGAFAAFFARFQSAERAEGDPGLPRGAKALQPGRAAASPTRRGADPQATELVPETAGKRPARGEGPSIRTPDPVDALSTDATNPTGKDARTTKARAKEGPREAFGAEGAASLLQAASAPRPDAGASAQSRKEGDEAERSGKLEESPRKRGKTRREEAAGPELKVVDLRLKLEAPAGPDAQSGPRDGGGELSALRGRAEGAGEGSGKADAPSGMEAARGKSFTDALAARLGSEGAVDIVKAAQIVLKDGDSGLIRLRLEPESLGGVKIELRLAEKSIEGRILVESEEAKAAFEKALDGLKDAFAREGFESSSLEVSVGSEGREGNPGAGPGEDSGPFWSERLSSFDRAVPTERAIEARRAEGRVDILA